jgi:hypothetical protein
MCVCVPTKTTPIDQYQSKKPIPPKKSRLEKRRYRVYTNITTETVHCPE